MPKAKNPQFLLGTASKLHRTLVCPASNLLSYLVAPTEVVSDAATRGTGIHKYLEVACGAGRRGAFTSGEIEEIGEELHEWCEAKLEPNLHLAAGRHTAPHFLECTMAIDTRTGEVEEVAADGPRDYSDLEIYHLPGTADVLIPGYKTLEVYDYKTGRAPSPKLNPQLMHNAYSGVKLYAPHADTAILGIQKIDTEGRIRTTTAVTDRLELDDFAAQVKRTLPMAEEFDKDLKRGKIVPVVPGPHCRFCDAYPICAASGNHDKTEIRDE